MDAPEQSAEAPDGTVYIADSNNDRIRGGPSTGGVISTFAGGSGGA